MAQNRSVFVFVWKTSNHNRGRSNLRNGMDQVTNLKSVDFTRKKIANLLGVLIPIFLQPYVLWQTVLRNQYLQQLLQKQIIHLHQPYKDLCFHLPSLQLWYWGTVFLNLAEQMVAGFHPSDLFAMFATSRNDFTISFEAFSLFMVPLKRGMHWPPAVFIVLTN